MGFAASHIPAPSSTNAWATRLIFLTVSRPASSINGPLIPARPLTPLSLPPPFSPFPQLLLDPLLVHLSASPLGSRTPSRHPFSIEIIGLGDEYVLVFGNSNAFPLPEQLLTQLLPRPPPREHNLNIPSSFPLPCSLAPLLATSPLLVTTGLGLGDDLADKVWPGRGLVALVLRMCYNDNEIHIQQERQEEGYNGSGREFDN